MPRLYSDNCTQNFGDGQCIVYKNTKPRTFSNFVDKVIGEFPVTVSPSSFPVTVKDPNDPYDVLRSKGLINTTNNDVRIPDRLSEVGINFCSEETRRGGSIKVFTSNHRFKDGKLVSSSTREELSKELPKYLEERIDHEEMRKRRVYFQNAVKCHSALTYDKSSKKRIRDILQEDEKQKIIQRYETAADRRHRFNRSHSTLDICETNDRSGERFLHTLRSENYRKKLTPCIDNWVKITPPKKVNYYAACVYSSSKKSPEGSVHSESASEISISSKEYRIHKSPQKTYEKNTEYDLKYRRASTPERRKPNPQDLFVIPSHTCHQIPEYRPRVSSFKRNTLHRYVKSGKHEDCEYEKTSDIVIEKDAQELPRKHMLSHQKHDHQGCMTQNYYSREKSNFHKSSDHNNKVKSRLVKPPKSTIKNRQTGEDYSIRECYHEAQSSDFDSETEEIRQMVNRRICKNSLESRARKPKGEKKLSRKENRKDKSLSGKCDVFQNRKEEKVKSESSCYFTAQESGTGFNEEDSDSDSSDRTYPFSISPATEIQKEYEVYNYSTELSSGVEDVHEDKKVIKTKKQINPNKVTHFEESGKRLSQYYDKGKATLHSRKAFENEKAPVMKKKTHFLRESHTAKYPAYVEEHEPTVRGESRKYHLRQKSFEELETMKNIVNKAALENYRGKYTNNSVNMKSFKTSKSPADQTYDAYKSVVATKYSRKHPKEKCVACEIERELI